MPIRKQIIDLNVGNGCLTCILMAHGALQSEIAIVESIKIDQIILLMTNASRAPSNEWKLEVPRRQPQCINYSKRIAEKTKRFVDRMKRCRNNSSKSQLRQHNTARADGEKIECENWLQIVEKKNEHTESRYRIVSWIPFRMRCRCHRFEHAESEREPVFFLLPFCIWNAWHLQRCREPMQLEWYCANVCIKSYCNSQVVWCTVCIYNP